jgi:hypothetical protein
MTARLEGLETIPGIGEKLSEKLKLIGIGKVSDLKNRDPEQLYDKLQETLGSPVDRCVLYTFRCAVYFASHASHDPEMLKWWNWKGRSGGW